MDDSEREISFAEEPRSNSVLGPQKAPKKMAQTLWHLHLYSFH